MNSGDKKKLNDHLKTHLAFVRGTLTVNQIQPPDQVREHQLYDHQDAARDAHCERGACQCR